MNFVDESEINTEEIIVKKDKPYVLTDEHNVFETLVDEANRENEKVTEDMFSEREIPYNDFDDLNDQESPEESRAKNTASSFIVETADEVISKALAAYAHTDSEKLKGSPQQIKKVAKYFAPYFGADNFNLPPWVMGAIAAGILLFDKFKIASEIRKVNLELEAEKEKSASLQSRINQLESEIHIKNLEKKIDKLQTEVQI